MQIFTSWVKYSVLCLVAQSCPTVCDPMDCSPPGSSVHGDSPGKNTGVGGHALLQGIFPAQGSNSGLPRCRRILYHLSPQGSSVIYSFWCICKCGHFLNFPSKRILLLHRNAKWISVLIFAPCYFAEFIYYLEYFCGVLRSSTYELMSHVNIDNSTSIFHIWMLVIYALIQLIFLYVFADRHV